jgi:hypothetical protein
MIFRKPLPLNLKVRISFNILPAVDCLAFWPDRSYFLTACIYSVINEMLGLFL